MYPEKLLYSKGFQYGITFRRLPFPTSSAFNKCNPLHCATLLKTRLVLTVIEEACKHVYYTCTLPRSEIEMQQIDFLGFAATKVLPLPFLIFFLAQLCFLKSAVS